MPEVSELAEYVARRVGVSRVARLTAGETVRFGVFDVFPATLRHTPRKLADRPSVPVTAPWSQMSGVGVEAEGLFLTVVLADGQFLTDSSTMSPIPNLRGHRVRDRQASS
jgi:hypothetical protein